MIYDWRAEIAAIIAERDRLVIAKYTTTNLNATEVGALFDMSHTTVTNILAKHGVQARPRAPLPNPPEWLARLGKVA